MKKITSENNFFKGNDTKELLKKFGSPLYVYNEDILLERAREMKNLCDYDKFKVYYSAKANTSIGLLQILKREGIFVDATSMGEIFVEMEAGFSANEIIFVSNNITKDEMIFALEKNVRISVDSLSQLKQIGEIFKDKIVPSFNGGVAVRFNSGVGAGHSEKVVTGGKKTKFGINSEYIEDVKKVALEYGLTIIGIHQHIGSLFMDGTSYVEGVTNLINIAKEFPKLEFVDMGGGFGIPYKRAHGEERLDIQNLGKELTKYIKDFVNELGRDVEFVIEPGRYIACECGVTLGTVTSVKQNDVRKFIGCDIGFNVMQRPVMYDSYHEIEIHGENQETEPASVCGNICESGDTLCTDRMLPKAKVGDTICVLDTGAYGFTMSSSYNNRLRPAEVLIRSNGEVVLLRERETFESLVANQKKLY